MSNLKDIAYCGLYCRLCTTKSRVPQTASLLRDTLSRDGWENYGEYILPDFKIFWTTLNNLASYEKECPGCRGGCGDPGCKIRKCAEEQKIELCPFCTEYPCEHIDTLARKYPNLISDGQHLKEIGIESWIKEQEDRRKTGFCYSDIRFPY